jgi:biotin synthase-like enzyme
MTGNYLTTAGRDSNLDIEMIKDLGLEPLMAEDSD